MVTTLKYENDLLIMDENVGDDETNEDVDDDETDFGMDEEDDDE